MFSLPLLVSLSLSPVSSHKTAQNVCAALVIFTGLQGEQQTGWDRMDLGG